jgi:outer membrane protein OmpA-like peptidoglycan-associated protein
MSEERADTIGRWLVRKGVDCGRVSAFGYGESRPAAPNDTAEGRAQNRRVLLFIQDRPSTDQFCAGR